VKKRHWRDIEAEANSTLDRFVRRLNELGRYASPMPPIPIREICALRPKPLSINPVSDLRYDGKKLAGMLDPKERAISIEARDILGRQHFSIAHELGHYKLHWLLFQVSQATPTLFPVDKFVDETFTWYFRCTPEDMELQASPKDELVNTDAVINQAIHRAREVEANQFASFLLMPGDMVRDWAKRLQGDLRRLAYQFEVSPAAMRWRLTNLRLRIREEEVQAQRHFFLHLSNSTVQFTSLGPEPDKADSTQSDDPPTILVTPESRLRTLISEVDTIERAFDKIVLDFSPLETGKLGAIGPNQALDLVLLNDYLIDHIIPLRAIATENLFLAVRLPTTASYVSRHLSRLGVFEHLRLDNARELVLSLPREPDTAMRSGARVLIPLTKIEAGVDVQEIAQGMSTNLLNWAGQSTSLQGFADIIQQVVLNLAQNVIEHSGAQQGLGKGYVVALLDRIVRDDQVTGYRALISVGDIGVGVKASLARTQGVNFESDFEALHSYLNGPTMSQLKMAITHNWHGHLQLNSGDAMLSVGARSTSYLTGLYRVPGLQVTTLIACQL